MGGGKQSYRIEESFPIPIQVKKGVLTDLEMSYPNTPRPPSLQACTCKVAPTPINHSSCSSPTCSHRTSSPLEKSQPKMSRMPGRETCKSPQAFWQPVTTPSAITSFPSQLPLVSSERSPSAASADGAPHENANAHMLLQPGTPIHLGKRGSCLGSHTWEGPHTTSTHKRNVLKTIWGPLSLASRGPVALRALAPHYSVSTSVPNLFAPVQKWLSSNTLKLGRLWHCRVWSWTPTEQSRRGQHSCLGKRRDRVPDYFSRMAPVQQILV